MPDQKFGWTEYRDIVFWSRDARLGYLATVVGGVLVACSQVARHRVAAVAPSGLSVVALGLGFVVTAFSVLVPVLGEEMVDRLDALERKHASRSFSIRGVTLMFHARAALAAIASICWLLLIAGSGPELSGAGWEAGRAVVGALATGLTVWVIGGLVQLSRLVAALVTAAAGTQHRR